MQIYTRLAILNLRLPVLDFYGNGGNLTFATLLQISYLCRQPFMNMKINWDALGIGTSVLCAIHCALLPVLVSSLPVFGINIVHNLVFEWSMIALAFVVGSYSLFHGYIKHHRAFKPVLVFSIGFIFLILKQFSAQLEIPFLIIAVVCIISAHYYNYVLCQRSKCSSPHHKH